MDIIGIGNDVSETTHVDVDLPDCLQGNSNGSRKTQRIALFGPWSYHATKQRATDSH
jgi:hypothetical protein